MQRQHSAIDPLSRAVPQIGHLTPNQPVRGSQATTRCCGWHPGENPLPKGGLLRKSYDWTT